MNTFELFLTNYKKAAEELEIFARAFGVNMTMGFIENNRNVYIRMTADNANDLLEDEKNGFVKPWCTGRGATRIIYYDLTNKARRLIEKNLKLGGIL